MFLDTQPLKTEHIYHLASLCEQARVQPESVCRWNDLLSGHQINTVIQLQMFPPSSYMPLFFLNKQSKQTNCRDAGYRKWRGQEVRSQKGGGKEVRNQTHLSWKKGGNLLKRWVKEKKDSKPGSWIKEKQKAAEENRKWRRHTEHL